MKKLFYRSVVIVSVQMVLAQVAQVEHAIGASLRLRRLELIDTFAQTTAPILPYSWDTSLQLQNVTSLVLDVSDSDDFSDDLFDEEQTELEREKELLNQVTLDANEANLAPDWLKGIESDLPLADHPWIETYVRYFTGSGRWFFKRWLQRAERYMPIMQPILANVGVPQDLIFLAMIESGFVAHALSHARAQGFWQFMPHTGQAYGLQSSVWHDDRQDFINATHSAGRYLKKLYDDFGDWHLAMAAYNAGEKKISRAMAKTGAKTFWQLIAIPKVLAKETTLYVPKIIAAMIVTKQKERFGLADLEQLSALHSYDEIAVSDATDLRLIADKIAVHMDLLRDLNPSLKYDMTPPGVTWTLRVPTGQGDVVASWLQRLPANERVAHNLHTVGANDTLLRIARRYRTSPTAIRSLNENLNTRHLELGANLIIPRRKPAYAEKTYRKSRSKQASMSALKS